MDSGPGGFGPPGGLGCVSGFGDFAPDRQRGLPLLKLNTARFDTTYEAVDAQARRYAYFRWDGDAYCRYPTGWQGPGAYHVGDRFKPGQGWDGSYPWQGPGVDADHDGDESMEAYRAEYAHAFGTGPFCATVHHDRRHIHRVVLRRKD